MRFLSSFILVLILSVLPATAAKRVALVIGNDAYENVEPLKKAVNDASAVGKALRELKFDVVEATNVARRDFNRKLLEFSSRLDVGDTAFFFFAGHGIEIAGRNFLLPTDIPQGVPGQEEFVSAEAISVDRVLQAVRSRGARVSILVLDACRDNPFKSDGTRSLGGTRGLARLAAPAGTFVMYSAGIGQTALDRLGDNDPHPNSVFTRNLVPMLQTPGLSLVRAARQLRRDVQKLARTVSHNQRPAYYDEMTDDFFLAGKQSRQPVQQPAPPSSPSSDELAALREEIEALKKQQRKQERTQPAPPKPAEKQKKERLAVAPPPPSAVRNQLKAFDYVSHHGMSSGEYQQLTNRYVADGYQISGVDGYATPRGMRYVAIWRWSRGGRWVARHALNERGYQSAFTKFTAAKFEPSDISAAGLGQGNGNFSAVWGKSSGRPWLARHNLTGSAYQAVFSNLVKKGFRLTDVEGYTTARGVVRYAAKWSKRGGGAWQARHGQTGRQFQATFNQLVTKKYRLTHVDGYWTPQGVRYASIFERGGSGGAWYAHHGLTSAQYAAKVASYNRQGFRLRHVSGYWDGKQERFAAIWRK